MVHFTSDQFSSYTAIASEPANNIVTKHKM
jgi:hypothetical protein